MIHVVLSPWQLFKYWCSLFHKMFCSLTMLCMASWLKYHQQSIVPTFVEGRGGEAVRVLSNFKGIVQFHPFHNDRQTDRDELTIFSQSLEYVLNIRTSFPLLFKASAWTNSWCNKATLSSSHGKYWSCFLLTKVSKNSFIATKFLLQC